MPDSAFLHHVIAVVEAHRADLGGDVTAAAVAALRAQLPAAEMPPARAERKPVTILFADLVGFTTLTEQVDAETVRWLVNLCFDTLKDAVVRYGGHIDKYLGDEMMVLFGAPLVYEDHAERALRAALALQAALNDINARLTDDPRLAQLPAEFRTLGLHIGVNTGMVVAGGVGAHDAQQYTVIGDAVNVAARLTSLSQAGQIFVGAATYQLTAPLFEFTALPPVALKGKREPQSLYVLRQIKARPGRVRGLEPLGLYAPLIGRQTELARLQDAVAQLRQGQGGVASLIAEAGVGKSRLVAELRLQAGVPVYEGRCFSYGETLSYHPFLTWLRAWLEVAPEADAVILESQLQAHLADLLPARTAELYPYLAALLGLPLEPAVQERLNGLAGESRQWQTFRAMETVLCALAERAPLLVVMEDLHWVDPTSATLLEQLLSLARQMPILFLLVQRPFAGHYCERLLEVAQSMPGLAYTEVRLAPLSAAQSRELIWRLLAIEALPEAMRELILSRAEGNPLYLEEIIRSLIGQGVLEREGAHWRLAPGVSPAQIDIPTTLQGVILARLDRLEAETKTVLQMAAVIGRIFWYRVLDYLTSVEERMAQVLDTHLTRLEQVELIRQTRHLPDAEYIFKHILIQDAAYQSLLREQRQRFHQRVAEAMKQIFADTLEEQYGLLAHHYELAGDIEATLRYLHLAGDQARRAYALEEAETCYERALALLPPTDIERRRQFLFDLGLVSLTRGNFVRAGEHYTAAFRLQDTTASHPRRYAASPLRILVHPPRDLRPGIPVDMDSARIIQQLFVGLVDVDAELNIVPAVAERWEVDRSGCRYRFHLRRNARWSDGAPLTAHDFVYAWRLWLAPESGSETAALLDIVRGAREYRLGQVSDPETVGVQAIDDHTLEVELAAPCAYFLQLLRMMVFDPAPRHAWPPQLASPDAPPAVVGNGPFRLVQWKPEHSLILEHNPYYSGIRQGNVGRIELLLRGDTNADNLGMKYFLADQIDVCGVNHENVPAFASVPPERWRRSTQLATFYCGLVPTRAPLDDRRVRQALVCAIDRVRLEKVATEDQQIGSRGGFIPPGIPGHSPELAPPYDLDRARALLREAGYPSPADLPPLYYANDHPGTVMRDLLSQWQDNLGITIIMDGTWSIARLLEMLTTAPPHLFGMSWIADYPDPHTFIGEGFVQQHIWRDAAYWDLVRTASCTLDVRQRMALYHELDKRLTVDEAICIPLTYWRTLTVMQERVRYYPAMPLAYSPYKEVILADGDEEETPV